MGAILGEYESRFGELPMEGISTAAVKAAASGKGSAAKAEAQSPAKSN
jgi:hypothetical protein